MSIKAHLKPKKEFHWQISQHPRKRRKCTTTSGNTFCSFRTCRPYLLSAIGHWLGWSVAHPAKDETIHVVNLLSKDGLAMILDQMVTNFTSFAPLRNCVGCDAGNRHC
jgi:hypothetical protein